MADFQNLVWDFYQKNRRDMPWRPPALALRKDGTLDQYKIFVSEIMLQQTQISRVIPKYLEFLTNFPSAAKLAKAPLRSVLAAWKGLGYNRRALNLKRAAEIIVRKHGGKLPATYSELVALPGIGPNTAGSILAFAYNIPHPFIETNIRSVFIHHFFKNKAEISDTDILSLVEKTLHRENVREWYYALMDYGAMLKQRENPNLRSRHYARQTPFKGSRRELRAKILDLIVKHPALTISSMAEKMNVEKEQALEIVTELQKEGFIALRKGSYVIRA